MLVPGEKGKAEEEEERCQEEDGKPEAGTSGISNEKLAAKLGLCQHVLPASGRNDGLVHLPFVSGKFPLHPVCYELTGICLIAFATRLAEIRALLLRRPGLSTWLQGRRGGCGALPLPAHGHQGREGWSRAALSSQASRTIMPERRRASSQEIPAATSHRGGLDADVAHTMRQASGCFTSRGRCLSPADLSPSWGHGNIAGSYLRDQEEPNS